MRRLRRWYTAAIPCFFEANLPCVFAAGTYNTLTEQSVCPNCEAGRYTVLQGQSSLCDLCGVSGCCSGRSRRRCG